MNSKIRDATITFCGLPLVLGVFFFVVAIYRGCQPSKEKTEVHVFINESGSFVNQLQTDVNHLTKLIESIQKDSVVVTVDRGKRKKN